MHISSGTLLDWSYATAEEHLRELPRRWAHVQAVAALAREIAHAIPGVEELLEAAAVLHDIGYSPRLAQTGFHPLDGGRFIREQGHEDLARLIAHHSGARNEARLRALAEYDAEFPRYEGCPLDRALTFCDLTTGPSGVRVRLDDRIAEIQRRYGAGHVVSRAIAMGIPEFERAVVETEARIATAGIVLGGLLAYPD